MDDKTDECHTHTPRKHEKVYYSYNEAVWRKQGRFLSRPKNGLKEHRGVPGLGFSDRWGAGLWWEFPCTGQSLLALDEGQSTYAFLPACPDVGQKGKGEWWGLKAVSHQASKIQSVSLLRQRKNLAQCTRYTPNKC